MTEKKKRAPLDPAATREKILNAAIKLVAKNGASNLALTDVVRAAGVHRGTVYQHFKTRKALLKATVQKFSAKFHEVVLGEIGFDVDPLPRSQRMIEVNIRFANFVMDNPELCRIWLFEVLSSPDPSKDPVWKEYEGSFRQFFQSQYAQEKMDSEVIAVMTLACGVLWPVWARAHAKTKAERQKLAARLTNNLLRMALHGSLKSEYFPELATYLNQQD